MKEEHSHSSAEHLQEHIFGDTHNVLSAAAYDRWQHPKFAGELEEANAKGTITGKCGDTMNMFLRVEDDVVRDASYVTDGCASSNICGSFAAEMAIGKTIEDIFDLTGEDVLEKIGSFPNDEVHCAFLAIKTVQEAANNYMVKKVGQSKH